MAQMLLPCRDNHILLSRHKISVIKYPSDAGPKIQRIVGSHDVDLQKGEGSIRRVRERFGKVELSVSSYDTAWVAMVPSKEFEKQPCFPKCLEWVVENQHPEGSWGLFPTQTHPFLVKDSLSSTLACVLALQKWRVGEQLVQKGLDFIGSNGFGLSDKHQSSPIGFDIIFPGMIIYAQELGLNLPLDSTLVDLMLRNRELQLQRGKGGRLAYIAEGLGDSYDWKEVMNQQRSNGSLFNSPASTAAALIHRHDDKCFDYLQSLLKIYGNAVPTIYPFDIYTRLCMVDTIERLGIDGYFRHEIEIVLDETHRCWKERNEEIFQDVACCAMAFRLLRMKGYQIAPDALAELVDEVHFFDSVSPQFTNTETIIQLHRASQIKIFKKEPILEKLHGWTTTFLKHQLLNQEIYDDRLHKEVEFALDYSIDSLDRLGHRKSIELYNGDNIRMLKTSYRCSNIDNRDFAIFSLQDFNKCQAIHLEELKQLEKWVKDSRLDGLKFEWHTLMVTHFLLSSVHFSPELADARVASGKVTVIGTIIDDMFDIDGTMEELHNIIELVEKWDGHSDVGYCSERIEILFSALQAAVNELAAKAFIKQGRCVKQELIQIFLDFLKCCLREVEWWTHNTTPSLDEYIANGCATIGVGLWFVNFYFLGPQFSEAVMKSEEYNTLYNQVGIVGRLFNDYQGFEREKGQRKNNGCWLLVNNGGGGISEDEAMREMRRMIENSRRELVRMMVQTKGSLIPKAFKESVFRLSKIHHYVYGGGDEYRLPGETFVEDIKAVLYDPLALPQVFGNN